MHLKLFRQINKCLRPTCALALLIICGVAMASEYHGQVTFGGLPVPGATVTATQGGKKVSVVTDQQGTYFFPDLPDGAWTIDVEMQCFSPAKQDITIAASTPAVQFELKLLSLDQILAQAKLVKVEPKPVLTATAAPTPPKPGEPKPADTPTPEAPKPSDETSDKANDGLLVNGSVNNAATSQFSLAPAFGNQRKTGKGLYNGGLAIILDNSALDARPYSLTGSNSPRAPYNRVTGVVTLGGPLNIKRLMPKGPNFFLAYQWTRDRNANTLSGLVPTDLERQGDFSQSLDAHGQPIQIFDSAAHPYPGNKVPIITDPVKALLNLYPHANATGDPSYNYQVPVLSSIHQDSLQSRLDKTIGRKNQVYGGFAFQNTRTSGANLFGFVDKSAALGLNTNVNWVHRFSHGFITNVGYRFSRIRSEETPYFANRQNISGQAGIPDDSSRQSSNSGNDQSPNEWGPPTLSFSSGIATLSDANSSFNRNRTDALSVSTTWNRGRHFVTFGGDFRRQEFNYLSQQNPRGTLEFTAAATQGNVAGGGSAFADFLLGLPDTSSIAFGNADKYLRQSVYDAFVTDDWRIRPDLTLNVGARWEYGAPITELKGRLVNIDTVPDFSKTVQPVLASSPTGPLTGTRYPDSLIRPDKTGFEPRIGLSWRPIPGSTVVVRAGYGIYRDTSIYQSVALALSQQAPLSKSLKVQRSSACQITLATPFQNCSTTTADTFGVDPNFRAGYAQNWQLSVQRDLPFALQLTATYLGIKGTHGVQEYLPNSYPLGGINPCPACSVGFVYRGSGGNSTRQAAQLQLRRRLRSGFTSSLQYVYSKSIDDDSALGGQGPVAPGTSPAAAANAVIAQDWRNLRAERGLSSFDQRHLLTAQVQYTSGMGIGGSTLLTGWRGKLLKEWTAVTQITAGTGLPETPIYFATTPGTGFSGIIRPNVTGVPLYSPPAGLFLNPAAFIAPTPGQWGNARKNSVTGPGQFGLNASLSRTFRLKDRYNLDLRVDSTNLLNHAVFSAWNTTINSSQFGSPVAANAMRSLQTTMRLRF